MNQRIVVAIEKMSDEERFRLEQIIRTHKGVVMVYDEKIEIGKHKDFENDVILCANMWAVTSLNYHIKDEYYRRYYGYIKKANQASQRIRRYFAELRGTPEVNEDAFMEGNHYDAL